VGGGGELFLRMCSDDIGLAEQNCLDIEFLNEIRPCICW
jgi:hypothetical protein